MTTPVWFGATSSATLTITPVHRHVGQPPHFILCSDGAFRAKHNCLDKLIAMAAEWQVVPDTQIGKSPV